MRSINRGEAITLIDRDEATALAETHVMKAIKIEPVVNTSKLVCCGVNLSEYHVFWLSSLMQMAGGGSYLAVHKEDGSVINFGF